MTDITIVMANRPCEQCIMFGAKQLLLEKGMRCYECLRDSTKYGWFFKLYPLYVRDQEAPQCPMCGAMCEWYNLTKPVPGWYCPNHHFIITASDWTERRKVLEDADIAKTKASYDALIGHLQKKKEELSSSHKSQS